MLINYKMETIYSFGDQESYEMKRYLSNEILGFFNSYNSTSFYNILKSTGSVIAGGIILNNLNEFDDYIPTSLSIYCTFRGAKIITNFLRDIQLTKKEDQVIQIVPHVANLDNVYSFFLKSRVRTILEYNVERRRRYIKKIKFMIVDNQEDIIHAVTNFDISFTRVWFDGESVKTTNLEDIKNKEGYLDSEYIDLLLNFNPTIIKRMMKYRERGFKITYNTADTSITIGNKSDPYLYASNEKRLVEFLYKKLISELIISQNLDYEFILGSGDLYIKYFYIKEFTINEFISLLKRLSKNMCILPLWISNAYIKNEKEIVNALALQVCGLLNHYIYEPDGNYKNFVDSVLIEKFGIDSVTTNLSSISEEYESKKYYLTDNNREDEIYERKLYVNQKKLCIVKDEENRFLSYTNDNRKKMSNRSIPFLDFVKPKKTEDVRFREASKIETMRGCYDIVEMGIYDINSYLRGEAVEAYNDKDERDETLDIPAVPPEVARERLVFFVSKSWDNLDDLIPYCYNLQMLQKDISKQIFYECDNDETQEIKYRMDNPVIQLNVGGRIHVPLAELLYALYKTKKQSFILIPSGKKFERTASLSTTYGNTTVSGTHCGEGTDINLYTIRSCLGDRSRNPRGGMGNGRRGRENLCWPGTEGLKISEENPSEFFITNAYYVINKNIDKLEVENERIKNTLDKVRKSLAFLDEIGEMGRLTRMEEYGGRIHFLIQIFEIIDNLREENPEDIIITLDQIETEISSALQHRHRSDS